MTEVPAKSSVSIILYVYVCTFNVSLYLKKKIYIYISYRMTLRSSNVNVYSRRYIKDEEQNRFVTIYYKCLISDQTW